jgi:hypothetical protein
MRENHDGDGFFAKRNDLCDGEESRDDWLQVSAQGKTMHDRSMMPASVMKLRLSSYYL